MSLWLDSSFVLYCFLPSDLFKPSVLHLKDINYCPFHLDCPFPVRSKLSHYWGLLTSVLFFLGFVLFFIRIHGLLHFFSTLLVIWTLSTLKCGFQNWIAYNNISENRISVYSCQKIWFRLVWFFLQSCKISDVLIFLQILGFLIVIDDCTILNNH